MGKNIDNRLIPDEVLIKITDTKHVGQLLKYFLPMLIIIFSIGNGYAGQTSGINPRVTFEFLPGGELLYLLR